MKLRNPLLFAALIAVSPQLANAQTAIIENGVAKATIFVSPKAPPTVTRAATDLQTHFKQISDVEIPITSDQAALKGFVIYLGDTDFARKQGIQAPQLAHDGYRILSNKNWMVIAGRDYDGPVMTGFENPFRINESYNSELKLGAFGDAGTLSGTYRFLEQYCGVRWYMPGPLGTVIPRKKRVIVPIINKKKAPYFQQRHCYYGFMDRSNDDTLWYRRAGYGSPAPIQVNHSFNYFFGKYKATNPEFFAIIDGKRDFTDLSTADGVGNLNLSDPGLLKQVISDVNAYFDDHPEEIIFPLCPQDGMVKISEDPVSQAQIDMSQGYAGEFSNYVWGFVNKVAKGIKQKHPDKFVGCFAYSKYSAPPTNIERLEPNVIVVITKMRAGYPNAQNKKDARARLAGWQKKASAIYNWEYYCNMLFNPTWKGYPMFFSSLLQEDLRSLKGISRVEFIEAESWGVEEYATAPQRIKINYPGVDHLLLYMTARLLWNPDLDVAATLSEYYKLFYGPAENPMRDFWETVEANWNKKGWNTSPSQVYDTVTIVKLLASLKDARSKTEAGSLYRQRVDLITSEFRPSAQISARLEKLVKPSIDVPLLATAPTGGADGPLPALAQGGQLLSFLDRNYIPASPSTNAQVAWDKDNFYVDMRCYEPLMDKLKMRATQRDSSAPPIWEDDAVEIFISPDAAQPFKSLHYIVTAAGTLYDAKAEAIGQLENNAWNGNAKVTVRREAARWVARLAIPWKDLGVENPQAGRKMAANFYRTRYASGLLMETGWAPMREGSFYSPPDFGTLTLGGQPAQPRVLSNPAIIQPAGAKEMGSGSAQLGLYYEGGIPDIGLFVGHANPDPRNDRTLVTFDLRPLLDAGRTVQTAELVFSTHAVTSKEPQRELDIRYVPNPIAALDTEVLSTEDTVRLATVEVKSADSFIATYTSNKPTVKYRVDATNLVKDAIASGLNSLTFRWQDILAEKNGNPSRVPVGVALSRADSGGLPELVITTN